MRLCDKISDKCFVIGGRAYQRPGLLKDEELTENFRSSGIAFKLEQINTVSDILTCIRKMEGITCLIVVNVHFKRDGFLFSFKVTVNNFSKSYPCYNCSYKSFKLDSFALYYSELFYMKPIKLLYKKLEFIIFFQRLTIRL